MKELIRRLTGAGGKGRAAAGRPRAAADAGSPGYDAEAYWSRRHSRLQGGFRSVGNQGLTEELNAHQYKRAVHSLLGLLLDVGIDPKGKRVLDIGCGNGFWAGVFQRVGVAAYCGIDVTDVLFDKLRPLYPDFVFRKNRVFELDPEDEYDLIVMIDVTQHITDQDEFKETLEAAKRRLSRRGVIAVTTWDEDSRSDVQYEVKRRIEDYERALTPLVRTELRPFRDKYITAFSAVAGAKEPYAPAGLTEHDLDDLVHRVGAGS